MEKVMKEDSVLSKAKEVELAFWADETERELYYRHERLLLDDYSAKHTYDFLLEQEREKTEQERERADKERKKAEQERKKAEQAELEKEKALKALEEKEKDAQDALRRGKLEMAHNLLKLGMDMERVVQASGLSEEEIRENRAP